MRATCATAAGLRRLRARRLRRLLRARRLQPVVGRKASLDPISREKSNLLRDPIEYMKSSRKASLEQTLDRLPMDKQLTLSEIGLRNSHLGLLTQTGASRRGCARRPD